MANPFGKSYPTQNLEEETKKKFFNIFAETKDTDGNIIETWKQFNIEDFDNLGKAKVPVKKDGVVIGHKYMDQKMAIAKAIVHYEPGKDRRTKHWSVQAIMKRLSDFSAEFQGDNYDTDLTINATYNDLLMKDYKTQLQHARFMEQHAKIRLDIDVLKYLGLELEETDHEDPQNSYFKRVQTDSPIYGTLAYWAKNHTANRLKEQYTEELTKLLKKIKRRFERYEELKLKLQTESDLEEIEVLQDDIADLKKQIVGGGRSKDCLKYDLEKKCKEYETDLGEKYVPPSELIPDFTFEEELPVGEEVEEETSGEISYSLAYEEESDPVVKGLLEQIKERKSSQGNSQDAPQSDSSPILSGGRRKSPRKSQEKSQGSKQPPKKKAKKGMYW